jgi:hypothetical protein
MTMSDQQTRYDGWRPVIPQLKWITIGVVIVLLGVWEIYYHAGFMQLPMIVGHGVNVLGAGLLVTGGLLVLFAVLQMYERQSADRGRVLDEQTQGLLIHDAQRDRQLLDLARDLALALVEITNRCDLALRFPEAVDARETLAAVKARAQELYRVERALVDLEQDEATLLRDMNALLYDYQSERSQTKELSSAEHLVP